MSAAIIAQLTELQRPSGLRMASSVITGLTSSLTRARNQLIRTIGNPRGAGFLTVPTQGTDSLLQNISARRIVWTAMDGNPFMDVVNHELKGGDSYPVLVAVLGTAVGFVPVVGTGAGLLFGIATTGLDLAKVSHSVIVRPGDQIWQIEEIGKVGNRAVHVGSYFVVDPFRQQTPTRGWLIHEERSELSLQ